tara:strand:+ start:53 stop:373 length:321 start_codon:yes stop_codon:yes gene_type:complete
MKSKRRFMHGKRRRRSPLKTDTLETTLADSVYSKEKVDKALILKGFDPNTRKVILKPGKKSKDEHSVEKYGVHDRKEVTKIDKRISGTKVEGGSNVPIAPDDYLRI